MNALVSSPPRLLTVIAVVALGVVGIALVTQHGFGMQPCRWCVLQRLIFVVIGAVALVNHFSSMNKIEWLGKSAKIKS